MENNEKITPSQYFDYLKNAKNEITTEALKESYGVFIKLAEKYKKLGQRESLKKLCLDNNSLFLFIKLCYNKQQLMGVNWL